MDLGRKRVLVVDDHPGMVSSLRQALDACGIKSAHTVRTATQALQRVRNMRYDVVLADYELGTGPNGQQLLEHLRANRLLQPGAAFLMVTAERSYERVMAAAEFLPDDYLVKPYTSETLRTRLVRVLERKESLVELDRLRLEGRFGELVLACDRLAASDPRNAAEVMRSKAEALLELGRHGEARAIYQGVLDERAAPWARLGLAQAVAGEGDTARARELLADLLGDAPEYLAAYDALARLHQQGENDEDAKAVLRMAIEVSPHALHRHRSIGEIALKANDLETAEEALSTLVRRGRNGFTRDSEDYLRLSRVLMQRDKFSQALETLAEAKKTFEADPGTRTCAATLESLVYQRSGNPRESRRALDAALELARDAGEQLDDRSALELARACYLNKREQEGAEFVRRVVSDNHDDPELLGKVRGLFGEVDRAEQGESLIDRCVNAAVEINNEGVARARAGDLAGSIELLAKAAQAMPGNAHIVMNAAHSLIAYMQVHGLDRERVAQVDAYIDRIRGKNPQHPKFLQVSGLYQRLVQGREGQAAA